MQFIPLGVARVWREKTQWDLRLETGINQTRISLIENGYVLPTIEEKETLARALELKVDEIAWPTKMLRGKE